MTRILELVPRLHFALIAAIAASLSLACGGSATTTADHHVGAGGSAAMGGSAGADTTGGTSGAGAQPNTGGSGGSAGQAAELGPGSWQVTGVVTLAQPNPGIESCSTLGFTLNVVGGASGYAATIGQDGFIDGASAEITNGSYVLGGLSLPCGNQLTVSGLTLRGTDANGDGKADGLSGSASGMAYSGGGDVVTTVLVQIELTGVPDVTAPTLQQPDVVDPLLGFAVAASEPLVRATSLTLDGSTTVALSALLQSSSSSGAPLDQSIKWSASTILPLSGQWSVRGMGQDPSGHALDLEHVMLQTLADPGVFAQDGFEGTLVAAVERGAPAIVTGLGSVPAISGAHSLWIAPGDAVLLHLQRAASEKTLRFSARAFGQWGPPGFGMDVQAGVVGGQQLSTPSIAATTEVVDTGDATWKQATGVQQFSIALSEPGDDVLLRASPTICSGFCLPASALMIDDLKLE